MINEVSVMTQIWGQLESMSSGMAKAYLHELSHNNYQNPGVDKLFANTIDYISATIDIEGTSSDRLIDSCIVDSVQAHIAMFVERRPQILTMLTPQDQKLLVAYKIKAAAVNNAVEHKHHVEQQMLNATQHSSARPLSRGARPRVATQTETTTPRGQGRSRGTGTQSQTVVTRPTSRLAARGIPEPKAEVQPTVVVETVEVDPYEVGKVINKKGSKVDYKRHQVLRCFEEGSKKAPTKKVVKFETDLRAAPIVKVGPTPEVEVEVLMVDDPESTVTPIQYMNNHTVVSDLRTAANLARLQACSAYTEMANSGVASITRFTLEVPIWALSDATTANITLDSCDLYKIVTGHIKNSRAIGLATLWSYLNDLREVPDGEEPSMAQVLVFEHLDKRATDEFNAFIQFVLCDDSRMSSFADDFPEAEEHYISELGVDKWQALIGENPTDEPNLTIGASIARRLNSYGLVPNRLNPDYEESRSVIASSHPIVMICLQSKARELGITFTTSGYNLLPLESDEAIYEGLNRLFVTSRLQEPDADIYFTTIDGTILHAREILHHAGDPSVKNFAVGLKVVS